MGFEIVHQLNIPLQPEVECSGLGLHVVLSLVAVPRAAAGEEAAAWRGFAPLPSRISVMPSCSSPGAAAQPLCPESLSEGGQISTCCHSLKSRSLLSLLGPWVMGDV